LDFILKDITGLFEDVDEGVQRVLGIVSGLKRFAHESDEIIEYDMNEGIESTLALSKNEFKYDAKLDVSYGDIPITYAYGSKINQVILGMIVNAVYAIRKKYKGKLGNMSIKTFEEDGYVCCAICDDGVGISEENKLKIFDPFYTTKPVGIGTGLGLSIARDIIVGQHLGKLDVESTVGEGTCFTIRIPISKDANDTLSDREDIIQILRSQYK
jgi:signal transduction histidine kinase